MTVPTETLGGSVANNSSQDEQRTTTNKKKTGENEVNGRRAHCQATGLENSAERNFNMQIKTQKSLQIGTFSLFFFGTVTFPSPRSLRFARVEVSGTAESVRTDVKLKGKHQTNGCGRLFSWRTTEAVRARQPEKAYLSK